MKAANRAVRFELLALTGAPSCCRFFSESLLVLQVGKSAERYVPNSDCLAATSSLKVNRWSTHEHSRVECSKRAFDAPQ
jgi:hypothetical protein